MTTISVVPVTTEATTDIVVPAEPTIEQDEVVSVEPVVEDIVKEIPTPKRKPGRPAGSKSKIPGKPRAPLRQLRAEHGHPRVATGTCTS